MARQVFQQSLSWRERDFPLVSRAVCAAKKQRRKLLDRGDRTEGSISNVILSLAEAQLQHQEALPTYESLSRVESAIMEVLKMLRRGVVFESATQKVMENANDLTDADRERLERALSGI